MSTPAVTPDPAPVVETEQQEVGVQERLDKATSKELDTWRKTGDIPAIKIQPKTAEPAPALTTTSDRETPSKEDASAASTAKTADAAAPPTVKVEAQKKHREKTKEDTARRFEEILSEVKTLRQENEEFRRRSTESSVKPESQSAKVETTTVRAEPKVDDVDEKTGKPKYGSYEAFLADLRKFDREQLLAEVDARSMRAQQERARTEQEQAYVKDQQVISERMSAKFEAGRKKYDDFDTVALNPKLLNPPGSIVDVFLLDSDHAEDVAYYLGQHPEITEGFYQVIEKDPKTGLATKFKNLVNPMRQHRELLKIEEKFSETSSATVTKPPKVLPPPPTELSARKSAPVDEAESALARGDVAAYMRVTNARELAARRR